MRHAPATRRSVEFTAAQGESLPTSVAAESAGKLGPGAARASPFATARSRATAPREPRD